MAGEDDPTRFQKGTIFRQGLQREPEFKKLAIFLRRGNFFA